MSQNTPPSRSLRESFATLPPWAQVVVSLLLAWFGLGAAFMLVWLIGIILMLIPWVIFLGAALLQAILNGLPL